ncbi:GntR family transcriptional regulator [Chondrocystis sp. NIES-4102]|nr:GntR family transcriptional regulator [Chondrocystis sp. NIES-4102]
MDLAINLDANSSIPLHRQLYAELRQLILGGKILPKQKIPSTRSLSQSLNISRTTVTQCYEQLISEGYLQTIIGSGTFVSAELPDNLLKLEPITNNLKTASLPLNLSNYGKNLTKLNIPGINELNSPISFRYGSPALEQFPIKVWRKLFARHCNNINLLGYSTDLLGHQPLRQAICNYLKTVRAINCHPGQILITNGSGQGLDLITRLLISPGQAIALENPGYLAARRIFQMQQAHLLPIPVDQSGLIISKLFTLPKPKLVYITPSHQFPTGAVLSLTRRLELLNWAQQTETVIIEDDYDSEFRYSSRPIPALQGLDRHNVVIYLGTFSKIMFPSLRIGYLVLPETLIRVFASARWLADRHTPALEQQMLTDFIIEGHLERHIRKMRHLYDRRRQTLVQALIKYFGTRVTIFGENAGIHLMVKIDSSLTDQEIITSAAKLDIDLVSTKIYYLEAETKGEFLFGYSELTEVQIEEGIYKLALIIT